MEETIAYIGPLEKNSKKSFLCENGCTADIISSNIFKNNEQRNCIIVPGLDVPFGVHADVSDYQRRGGVSQEQKPVLLS